MDINKKQKIRQRIFIIIGALLVGDTIFAMLLSNMNLGVILPAILGAPLLVYGIFIKKIDVWFVCKVGKIVKYIFIIGYIAFCGLTAVFCIMMGVAAANVPPDGADAIIVLGAGVQNDEVTDTLEKRLNKAIEYYENNPQALIVVTGGLGDGDTITEAQAMENYLVEQGIPKEIIIKEENATSTYENFVYSKEILDEQFGGHYDIVYTTNDFHILRAGIIAQSAGFASPESLAAKTPILTLPNAYLRETLALLATYVFG